MISYDFVLFRMISYYFVLFRILIFLFSEFFRLSLRALFEKSRFTGSFMSFLENSLWFYIYINII